MESLAAALFCSFKINQLNNRQTIKNVLHNRFDLIL